MAYDVVVKPIPKQWIASIREIITTYPSVGNLFGKVVPILGPAMANSRVAVALWHHAEVKEADIDAEAGFYFDEEIPAIIGARVYELPAVTVASILHNGAYQRLPEAYDALQSWVTGNGYEVAAPTRELYLKSGYPVRQDDESYVTEIQFPVTKVGS